MIGIMIIFGGFGLLKALYIKLRAGKIIFKLDGGKGVAIFYIVMLILWMLLIIHEFKDYSYYKELLQGYTFLNSRTFNDILWIELTAMLVISSMKGSEIRENGICYFYSFYSWQRIKGWKRIDENIIQLKISLFSKLSYRVKLQVSKYSIWSMIEILENHVGKDKKITFKENRAD